MLKPGRWPGYQLSGRRQLLLVDSAKSGYRANESIARTSGRTAAYRPVDWLPAVLPGSVGSYIEAGHLLPVQPCRDAALGDGEQGQVVVNLP